MSTTIVTGAGRGSKSYAVGKLVAAQAQHKLGDLSPDFVLVFASTNYRYASLLQG